MSRSSQPPRDFGALLAGSLPLLFGPRVLYHLLMAMTFATAEVALTPFLRSTMFLLAGGETPPIQVIRDLADIHDVVALADPQLLCAAWVAMTRKLRMLFFSRCLWHKPSGDL